MINQNNLHNDLLFLKNSSTVSFGYGNAQCGNNDPCEKQRQFCGAETRQHQTQTECHGKLAFAIAFPQPFAWHFHCCSLLTLFTLSYDDSKFMWLFLQKEKAADRSTALLYASTTIITAVPLSIVIEATSSVTTLLTPNGTPITRSPCRSGYCKPV